MNGGNTMIVSNSEDAIIIAHAIGELNYTMTEILALLKRVQDKEGAE